MKRTTLLALISAWTVCLSPVIASAKLVACVGDSNTFGAGLSNRVQDCYPAKLERILQQFDPTWETRNFGVNGASVLKQGDKPYSNLAAYNQALASEPDVVILCFGPNASRSPNRGYIEGAYLSDYVSIIDGFAGLPRKPKIWVCHPLKAFSGNYTISDTIIRDQIIPLITQIASERGLPIIDFYTAFENSPDLYVSDRIHPDPNGTTLMAEIVARFITGIGDVPDFNGDGIINSSDMCIMVDHWHTDDSMCDIAPLPLGDGFVDVQDLVMLGELLFEEVIDRTLVAHWALDETEGMLVADSAGDRSGYAVGDPVWRPDAGQVNGALEFDGINDLISAPAPLKPGDGPFSVLAWIKGGAPGQAIISEPGGPDWLSLDPLTGYLMTGLTTYGRSGGPLSSETAVDDGNWHRISLVWDGSYRTLYVDGIAVAEDIHDDLDNPGKGLYIGTGDPMAPDTFFSGLIDDVRIYNRAVKP